MILSLIVRTLNAERYLAELLAAARAEKLPLEASLDVALIYSGPIGSSWHTQLVQALLNGGVSARLHDPA